MRTQSFITNLWHRDMQSLSPAQQELATSLLIYASLELTCRPYHRASKATSKADRQTIFKHPVTGRVCLVLSAIPSPEESTSHVLRLDFFDKSERVAVEIAKASRAPNTQWAEKGERRFLVPSGSKFSELRPIIQQIVG